jgi:myosin-5
MLSFICVAESDMLQGIGPGEENAVRSFDWNDYERLVSVVKHDLDSLEYNIYHTWMLETKKKLSKMVIPALIESQSLPGFTTSDGGGRLFNRLLNANSAPAYSMDDILNMLNKVWKSLKSYYMEESVVQQVITELLKLIGVTSFNDLLMRRNFSSWKRGRLWSSFPVLLFSKTSSSHANPIQHHSNRRVVQVPRHAGGHSTTRTLDAGHQAPPVEEGVYFAQQLFRPALNLFCRPRLPT